ncbi:MAG TPA: hypothetical protein VJT84_13440 [Gaiellaceae bacterium]|nr:hypothetical protein [Gaiellaceae bacterium]
MPTRKQRRRLAKERRHDWEFVYVDEDGREVEPPPEEDGQPAPARPKPQTDPARTGRKPPAARTGKQTGKQASRPARTVQPPSWRRVARRAAVFAPVMVIVVYLLRPKNASVAGLVSQVLILLLFFLPFSYYMDVLMYRQYRKRIGDPLPPRQRKPRGS